MSTVGFKCRQLKQPFNKRNLATTTLLVHHTFRYISLPSLHVFDVKFPNFTFYGGRQLVKMNSDFLFAFSELGYSP